MISSHSAIELFDTAFRLPNHGSGCSFSQSRIYIKLEAKPKLKLALPTKSKKRKAMPHTA